MAQRAAHVSHAWHDISIGEEAPDVFNAVIEIPRGSKVKYELDKVRCKKKKKKKICCGSLTAEGGAVRVGLAAPPGPGSIPLPPMPSTGLGDRARPRAGWRGGPRARTPAHWRPKRRRVSSSAVEEGSAKNRRGEEK
jgi:hypothetical protein